MKKLFFYFVFAVFTFAVSQPVQAQQKPEVIAKQKVAELSQELNLSGEQQRSLFRVYVLKESDYAKKVNGKDLSNPEVAAAKKNIDQTLDKGVKRVLTDEQYTKYTKMKE